MEAFLHRQRVGHLTTVDEAEGFRVVPVGFAVHRAVYTPVNAKPKRAGSLRLRRVRSVLARPEVCPVAIRHDEDGSHLAWAQLRGQAVLVTEPDERAPALAVPGARAPRYGDVPLETRPPIRVS